MSTILLISTFFIDLSLFEKAAIFVPIIVVSIYILTYFSILEGVDGPEWLMLFILPVFFTLSAFFFYSFLIPIRWLTRIIFIAIYMPSIYFVFLTSNIFNVGVEKNLQLYRAAFSVNYFFQTVVTFLAFNTILALRENFMVNAVWAGLITFPLALQFFWSIKLNLQINKAIVELAFLMSLIMVQVAVLFSFAPFVSTVFALLLTAIYYSLAGLFYSYLDQRLFKETIREYLIVLVVVLVIGILTLQW